MPFYLGVKAALYPELTSQNRIYNETTSIDDLIKGNKMQTTIITKVKVKFEKKQKTSLGIFYKGKLMAESKHGCPISDLNNLADNMKSAIPSVIVIEVNKIVNTEQNNVNFDYKNFQNDLFKYCSDYINKHDKLPLTFQYNGAEFDKDEFDILLQESQYKELHSRINN